MSMTHTHTYKGIIWTDLESPTDEEIANLVKRYDLHPLVGEELKSSPSLAKIDFYDDYIMVVLTLPVRLRSKDGYEIVDRELDFVIGKNFLITSRFDTIEQLEYLSKIFDTNSILNKDQTVEHAGHLFYYMMKRIYGGLCDDVENIKDAIISAENHIFGGNERKMVKVLSDLSRELIDFRQTVRVHRAIWDGMTDHSPKSIFGNSFDVYIRDIIGDFNRIHELVANSRELMSDLKDTNDSLLNTKQNEIIKILTILAFIFNPLTFIASIFTIPAAYVPLVDKSYGWLIIVLIMILSIFVGWWLFKKKRWI